MTGAVVAQGLSSVAAAVRAGAGLFRLQSRELLRVRGADRVRWLDGMLSNEIAALEPGPERSGCYALLLTRQGRIVADLHVLQRGEELWLEGDAAALRAARETLEKLIVADDVALAAAGADFARLAVEGPTARAAVARVAGALPRLAPHAACDARIEGFAVTLGAWGVSGESALQLFAPAGSEDAIAAAIREAGAPLGLVEARSDVLEILRVEAGTPRFGCELGPDVLPAEARLEAAISTTKGCYTGQEIVERMRSRGQLSHLLVGIAFDPEVSREELPPRGSGVEVGGEPAGEITERGALPARRADRARLPAPRARGGRDAAARRRARGRGRRAPLRAPLRAARVTPARAAARGSGVLIVFAKAPRPGLVKTRLCPPLSPEAAAALYRCMLDDVLETSAAACRALALAAQLAVHPPEACAELAARAPAGFRVQAQRGADLAQRMRHAVRAAAAAGHRRILLRGSDSPELAPELLGEALAALDRVPLVIRPDLDGGYDLIGVRAPIPGLFEVEMSTGDVLANTLARAARAGLATCLLEVGSDLDTPEDLARLARDPDPAVARRCRRTLAWLRAAAGALPAPVGSSPEAAISEKIQY